MASATLLRGGPRTQICSVPSEKIASQKGQSEASASAILMAAQLLQQFQQAQSPVDAREWSTRSLSFSLAGRLPSQILRAVRVIVAAGWSIYPLGYCYLGESGRSPLASPLPAATHHSPATSPFVAMTSARAYLQGWSAASGFRLRLHAFV